MAVYKPSNFYPSSQEIDLEKENHFTCQINTSGETVKMYKIQVYNDKGDEKLWDPPTPTVLNPPIKNKGILKSYNIGVDNPLMPTAIRNNGNGKDYQWGIRIYNATIPDYTNISNRQQPNTLVCEGFLVGTTRYVVWCKIDDRPTAVSLSKEANDKIQYDRYIEFETEADAMFPIIGENPDNLVLPEGAYRERHKIDWVTKGLGFYKNFTKIECDESFKYNYKQKTPFKIFLCSDQHTLTSVYADPCDEIKSSNWIILYESAEKAQEAHTAGDTPDKTTVTPKEKARKVIGYSSVTGEIRVAEPFKKVPTNGMAYLLFEYDSYNKTYTEITPTASNVVGGVAITDAAFTVQTNNQDTELGDKQLFIQPNINIKSDATNPDEIVFESGERVDIIQEISHGVNGNGEPLTGSSVLVPGKDVDITIDMLDNTQWLLNYTRLIQGDSIPVIPKTNYKIYTDFMDSSPMSIFYARKEPIIKIKYQNLNAIMPNEWKNLYPLETFSLDNGQNKNYIDFRDIKFQGHWLPGANYPYPMPQIKYYHYYLYVYHPKTNNLEYISESEDTYDNELYWSFRGFDGTTIDKEIISAKNPRIYRIALKIVDEYDKEYMYVNDVPIYYPIEQSVVSLKVETTGNIMDNGENDCSIANEHAIKITCNAPVYVESTDYTEVQNGVSITKQTVKNEDLGFNQPGSLGNNWVTIPENKILNYTRLSKTGTHIILPEQFYYYSHFQILGDFIDYIPVNGKLKIWEVSHIKKVPVEGTDEVTEITERYTLTLSDVNSYYVDKINENVMNNPAQFELRLYRNYVYGQTEEENPPLACFYDENSGEYVDRYKLLESDSEHFIMPTNIKFALQEPDNFVLCDTLPINNINVDKKYILNEQDGEYLPDIYIYTNKGWEIDISTQYVYIDNLNNIKKSIGGESYTYDELEVPTVCRGEDGEILFEDTDDLIWVDTKGALNLTKDILNDRWFESLLVINPDINLEGVTCEIAVQYT